MIAVRLDSHVRGEARPGYLRDDMSLSGSRVDSAARIRAALAPAACDFAAGPHGDPAVRVKMIAVARTAKLQAEIAPSVGDRILAVAAHALAATVI